MGKSACKVLLLAALLLFGSCDADRETSEVLAKKPNFLIVVADDQSWPHTSFAGYSAVKTPAFDQVANNGVYFTNAYASAPSCTPSRSSLLSGRHFWQTGPGAILWGSYTEALPN
ncbi:MAG: sulfatase-like hydrolase/transferase, partial [Pseudomonadales bacterium]